MSSGTFLTWSLTALAPEWEKMTGAEETRRASDMVDLGGDMVVAMFQDTVVLMVVVMVEDMVEAMVVVMLMEDLETWERSTIMPSLFISLTTLSPKGVRPPPSPSLWAASAQGVLQLGGGIRRMRRWRRRRRRGRWRRRMRRRI